MDSMVALYRNDGRNKRGYHRIFYPLQNVTVVNAWFVWRWDRDPDELMDHLEFRSRCSKAADIQRGSGTKLGPPALHAACTEKRLDGGPDFPKKSDQKYAQRCRSAS
ncbi:hypothetical protein HPB47_012500 [Ixodes persulcatus]|uniref:Uncharacterized protein n=1 Tax=Ixodes persulcatus TaxID=34615 RepID=A0AC60NTG3_IXOPE|nr:hypothetical protein HPB47_012500 [Ixodes persulcatus]